MPNAFVRYVAGFETLVHRGRQLASAPCDPPQLQPVAGGAPVCLIFSPHPDDEAISGALPWRLRSEAGWRVVNVAVTLGSLVQRRAERWLELRRCCDFLGFDLVSASGESVHGLERISPQTASAEPRYWADCVARVAALLSHFGPRVVVCPHALDGHPAHMGTHHLVLDALRRLDPSPGPHVLQSEYWNTQMQPGLMVELGRRQVADLIAALSLHAGEVARNPYHLTLPAWFMDGVRRGAERVGVAGRATPDFAFAALYGWQRWHAGTLEPVPPRLMPLATTIDPFFA